MEVKPGYKQTEIGVIPEDWEMVPLSSCCDVRDGTHESPKYHSNGIPLVTSKNIVDGKLDLKDVSFISERDADMIDARSKVDTGDLLLSMIGTVGNVTKVDVADRFCIKNVALIKPRQVTGDYLLHLLRSDYFSMTIQSKLAGGIQKFISLGMLRSLYISIMSDHEQNKISETLSDIDLLITTLEKLIEKKKLIKQGVMQELLTGKRRLPGFSREWETKRLGTFCAHITTGRKDVNEGNPNGKYPFYTCSRAVTFSDHYSFDTEAILIAGNGDVGTLHYFTGKFEAYQRTYVLSGFNVNARYLVHYLNMNLVPTLCDSKIGTSIPYIKIGDLINMPVLVPMDDEELEYITSVLDDIESDIDMLELQLYKQVLLKQAMMQELLTGRIRLI